MSKIQTALDLATKFHEGQFRKFTGEPYITHPIAVAELFKSSYDYFTDEEMEDAYCAAILHDCVEDTDCTYDDLLTVFGKTITSYVWFLTKPENFVGNRKLRKTLDISRLSVAPDIVKAIKLCDLMHNSLSIEEYDPKFWITFKRETSELVNLAGFDYTANEYGRYPFVLGEYKTFIKRIS